MSFEKSLVTTVEIYSSGMLGFSRHISKTGVHLLISAPSIFVFRQLEMINTSHHKANPETAVLNTTSLMKLEHFSLGNKTVQLCVSGILNIVEVTSISHISIMARGGLHEISPDELSRQTMLQRKKTKSGGWER